MNYGGRIVRDMSRLLELFAEHCEDQTTLVELQHMLAREVPWSKAHALFGRIRGKTLVAERAGDRVRVAQYGFEEICAKTLYNLSGAAAPFDPDSPYWIVPNAFALAHALELDDSLVLNVVAG